MRLLPSLLIGSLLQLASAWPGNPGTCNVNKMDREGHGPSLSSCPDCYQIAVSTGSDHLSYALKVSGKEEFQGILLYVQDETNTTVGSFRTYDKDLYQPVECPDATVFDADHTIGHASPILKRWPVEFGWTAAVADEEVSNVQPGDKLTVRGMVVLDYDHWDIFPEMSFVIQHPAAKEKLENTDDLNVTLPHEHEHPNSLFYIVLSIAFVVYNGLSVLHRSMQQRRRRNRQSHVKISRPEDSSILLQDW
ncbi:hypothetical protein VKS41_002946 [Umbelopsis sp. WA50703]